MPACFNVCCPTLEPTALPDQGHHAASWLTPLQMCRAHTHGAELGYAVYPSGSSLIINVRSVKTILFTATICYSPFDMVRMEFRQWKLNENYCSEKIHTCTADTSHRHTCEFYPLKHQLQNKLLLPLLVQSINIRRIYHRYHNWTFSKNQEVCCINLKIFIALPVQSTYIIKFELDHQSYHKKQSGMHVKMQTLGSLTLISC